MYSGVIYLKVLSVVLAFCGVDGDLVTSLPFARAERVTGVRDGAVFDYIVVGSGAAGSAAATRLALAGNHVLLIEAGGDPGLLSDIPDAAMVLLGSDIDWFYETIPNNKSCLSSRGRSCRFSQGRCLGGSTSINYMIYTRGNPIDYDYNITGWSWREFKPYFLRYEGLQSLNRFPPSSSSYHNTTGPVKITFFEESTNPWRQRILKGLQYMKFPYNPDVNAKSQIGVTHSLGYVYGGKRVSTAIAYLYNNHVRRKLKIASNMRCTGVIIDENNIARGVTVIQGKDTKKAMKMYAKEEVILSAGTVGSAQLLLLSGVGPADHLKKLDIPARADLPVGENMSDHVLPLIIIKVDQVLDSFPNLSLFGQIGLDALQWLTLHNGQLASIGVTDIVAFANTECYDYISRQLKDNGAQCGIPNLQLIFSYIERYILHFTSDIISKLYNKNVVDQILAANRDSALLLVSPILLQPKSRGWVRLNSVDPLASPAIMPNYLSDDRDVDEIFKSVRIIEHMVQTPMFSKYNASFLELKLRGCPEFGQTGYWDCYVRHMTNSVYHAVGTVALGTVLDEKLRVKGVKRLRVGDSSVLRRVPRGNTAAATIAIGERLADFILQDKSR